MWKEIDVSSGNASPLSIRQGICARNLRMENRVVQNLARHVEHIEAQFESDIFANSGHLRQRKIEPASVQVSKRISRNVPDTRVVEIDRVRADYV